MSLGFDYGTSGARVVAVDRETGQQVDEAAVRWPSSADAAAPGAWTAALDDLLGGLPRDVNCASLVRVGESARARGRLRRLTLLPAALLPRGVCCALL